MRYTDGIAHGFVVVDVTPERVQADFWSIRSNGDKGVLVDPRLDPGATVGFEAAIVSLKGSRRLTVATGPAPQLGERSDRPRTAVVPPARSDGRRVLRAGGWSLTGGRSTRPGAR